MKLRAIIPAAGKGTRLNPKEGSAPKVMRLCAGRPLLQTVLENVAFIPKDSVYIVVGYKKETVTSYFGPEYHYVEQKEQLGTGHAVMVCEPEFRDFDGAVLVTFGDMPLFGREELQAICRYHEQAEADCTLMTAENPDLTMWARIVRDENGRFAAIVEGKDCTPEQAKIKELFSGVLVFNSRALFQVLPEVRTANVQHEYYLTEVPELMLKHGMKVETYQILDGDDLRGVNTEEDLRICEGILKQRLARR